ncbi:nucleotide sugar dehydrogenase [Nocardia brevicatena]|uniref:nucleotide sugar dehydrogenase n=1 Tax=Nocardia brevicatena TaxID=37327 RepID=UPI00031E2F9B|nr:nucleotide sugar dehydrogenase [Nocardia brevicatena]
MNPDHRVAIVGQGYVGLPIAMAAVEAGLTVIAVENDPRRLADLSCGKSYVESVSNEQLAAATATGAYQPVDALTTEMRFDVAVVAVPTPLGADGAPDLSALQAAARMVGTAMRPGCLVTVESTSYPGTTEDVVVPILNDASGSTAGRDFHVVFSPERINPGSMWTVGKIPKLVGGIDSESTARACRFYEKFVDEVVPLQGTREAELAKLIENTFRFVNIALVNEMAAVFADSGIDLLESLRGAATKPFGYLPFSPGPGIGGHCLPVDVVYLTWYIRTALGRTLRTAEAAVSANADTPLQVVDRIGEVLAAQDRKVNGARIVLLGLSYKPNIGDIRNSASVVVACELSDRGAVVQAIDPHVDPTLPELAALPVIPLTPESLRTADVVALLVHHDSFDADQIRQEATLLLDFTAQRTEANT